MGKGVFVYGIRVLNGLVGVFMFMLFFNVLWRVEN